MNKNKNSGFTLIELSIVLIIIGLIIGGILSGQELIKSAEARGIMTQIDKYNTALNVFKLKYSALPGDFSTASTSLPGAPTGGDGNGVIYTGTPAAVPVWDNEMLYYWQHLSAIGVIEGSFSGTFGGTASFVGTKIPYLKNNRGGLIVYGFTDNSNYYHLGVTGTTATAAASAITGVNVFLPDTAYAIDSKVDDGVANTGIIQAKSGPEVNPTASTTGCVNTAPTYNLTATTSPGYVCQLRYKMPS